MLPAWQHPQANRYIVLNSHALGYWLQRRRRRTVGMKIAAQGLEVHAPAWVNIAEIELSALTRQCLTRRIDDLDILNTELAAWQAATNDDERQVRWQFTTTDARIKLHHLYPNT